MQVEHAIDIDLLKRMAGRIDEVETAVHTIVRYVLAMQSGLSVQVLFVAILDVVRDRLPAFLVIYRTAVAGRVHHGQRQINVVLFQEHFVRFHLHRLAGSFGRSRKFVRVDVGEEH